MLHGYLYLTTFRLSPINTTWFTLPAVIAAELTVLFFRQL